jgi:hypothetical protein
MEIALPRPNGFMLKSVTEKGVNGGKKGAVPACEQHEFQGVL